MDVYGLPEHIRVTVGKGSENKNLIEKLSRFEQVVEATYMLHEVGVNHTDIHAENVIITPSMALPGAL